MGSKAEILTLNSEASIHLWDPRGPLPRSLPPSSLVYVEFTFGSVLWLVSLVASYQGDDFPCLQMILTPPFLFKCLGTDIKFDGFDINTCREMISLMDVSFKCHIIFTLILVFSTPPPEMEPGERERREPAFSEHMAGTLPELERKMSSHFCSSVSLRCSLFYRRRN